MEQLTAFVTQILTIGGRVRSWMSLLGVMVAGGVAVLITKSTTAGIIVVVLVAVTFLLALLLVPREHRAGVLEPTGNYLPVSSVEPTESASEGSELSKGTTTEIERVIFFHTLEHQEGRSFGMEGQFEAKYSVDFMQAALVAQHREILVGELARLVQNSVDVSRCSVVSCPKRGNPLLAAQLADVLNLQPIFVKEKPLFGRTLDGAGLTRTGDRALLVDDISSDGDLLKNAALTLREAGLIVEDAFVLIDRKEGDSEARLSEIDVKLHTVMVLGDNDLHDLVNRLRKLLS